MNLKEYLVHKTQTKTVDYEPLTREELHAIKPGDVIERMLAGVIPVHLIVQKVDDKIIDAGWKFDRNTGIEIDEDIPTTVSYIRKVLTEEDKIRIKNEREVISDKRTR